MDMPTNAGWYDDPRTTSSCGTSTAWSGPSTPPRARPGRRRPRRRPASSSSPGRGTRPSTRARPRRSRSRSGACRASPSGGARRAAPVSPAGGPAAGRPQQGRQQPGQQYPGQTRSSPAAPQQGGWNAPAYPGMQPVATTPDGQPLAGYWQRVGAFIIDWIISSCILGSSAATSCGGRSSRLWTSSRTPSTGATPRRLRRAYRHSSTTATSSRSR